jgi:hypothetical protein
VSGGPTAVNPVWVVGCDYDNGCRRWRLYRVATKMSMLPIVSRLGSIETRLGLW